MAVYPMRRTKTNQNIQKNFLPCLVRLDTWETWIDRADSTLLIFNDLFCTAPSGCTYDVYVQCIFCTEIDWTAFSI